MSQAPQPEDCTPPQPATPDANSIRYQKLLEALADSAQALTGAETKVLLELTRRQARTDAGAVQASSRDLATWCKISRSNAQIALDNLAASSHITTRQGTATHKARHRVNIFDTVRIGGPEFRPPPPGQWPENKATPDLFQGQGGPEFRPPPTENTALTAARARVDVLTALPVELDRVLKSKLSDFDSDLVVFTRRYLHSHFAKIGVDDDGRRFLDTGGAPHPPPDTLVAQLLAVAPAPRLYACLDNLVRERQHQPRNYGWFIAVALQRIHGITWQQTKAARAQLREVKRRQPPPQPQQAELPIPQQADQRITPQEFADLFDQAVAGTVAPARKLR